VSRYLFAWELGGNYGHVGRCLPVALALREFGHQVLFAVRDLRIATEQLGPSGLRCVQAPVWGGTSSRYAPANYAEMLLVEGYADWQRLWGVLQGWVSLLQIYRPDVLVADHAPTVLLARRIVDVRSVVVGTGFEIPPDAAPLPSIRPWEPIAQERLRASEYQALAVINRVLSSYLAVPLDRVAGLFDVEHLILATFAELDHYAPRPGAAYVGASFGFVPGIPIDWERETGPHVLAYLHPAGRGFDEMLSALARLNAEVICVAPGLARDRFSRKGMRVLARPVELKPVVARTQLAVTNAGAGTTAQLLLAGVPLVLLPNVIEQSLTARRAEALGAAIVLADARSESSCLQALTAGLKEPEYRDRARAFAAKHAGFAPQQVTDCVVRAALACLPTI
jgi:hypothetical protein